MRRALAVALLLLASCSGPVVGALSANTGESAARLFALTNQTRQAEGIGELAPSETMTRFAAAWSLAMANHNKLEHSSLPDGVIAENVGSIPAGVGWEQRLHQKLMESRWHRFNILDGRLKTLGIAVVISGGLAWVTEEFGLGDETTPTSRPTPTCTPIVRTNCTYRLVP